MRALILNCTLKSSPEPSNTEALANVVLDAFRAESLDADMVRVADFNVAPGVSNDEGDGDEWPSLCRIAPRARRSRLWSCGCS